MNQKHLSTVLIMLALFLFNSCKDKIAERPFIDPPFPGLSPEYTDFKIDANKSEFLEYKTGTTINIPESAWVDSLGNSITGELTLKYREFHEAIDIFLSGASLNYDTAGVSQNLTTAGMFEVRAYKDSNEVYIKPGKKLVVRMASYNAEDDYNFYSLNEKEKNWNYKGTVKPEINSKIAEITDTIKKLKPEYAIPLDKDKYFALSADAVLDVYFKDNYDLIYKNKKSNTPKHKAEEYGISWYDIYWYGNEITFKGAKFKAYQMVWENISGKIIPAWVKKDVRLDKLTRISNDIYTMEIADYKTDRKINLKVKAFMPLKYLFAYPPDKWKENYDIVIKRIEEESKRLAMQCVVFRTYDVTETGFHNWDRVYHREDKVLVKSDFNFDTKSDELSDIDVFYFVDNNKSFVKINLASTDTLMLVPDSTAKLVAVLTDTKAGIFSTTDYRKLDFNKLKNDKTYKFDMKIIDVKSKDEILKYIE